MAIVEMKKINLVAVTSDRKKLLRALQKLGCVQIEPVGGEEMKRWAISDDDELERTEQTLTRLKWAIGKLSKFDTTKKSLLAPRATAGDDEVAAAWASMNESMETIDALEAIDRRHMEAKSEESRILTRIAQLNPYRALMEPLELIGQTRLTMATLGLMDARRVDETRAAIEEAGLAGRFDVVSTDKDGAHIFAVSPLDEWNKFNRILKDSDFNQENFSEYTGTPAANIEKLKERINELRQSHAQLDDQARSMCDQLQRLKVLYDVMSLERDRERAGTLLAGTRAAFMMTGWVPAENADEVDKRLHEVSPSCVVELLDPADDENPPTMLKNNKFLAPYQSIIAMYSLPNYRGIDPTLVMTPFFICFFGMMVSDAGYGVLMGIIAALAVKLLKPRGTIGDIAKILVAGGAATLFWGVLYGGWFGINVPAILFAPMDKPLEMMILCVGLGMVHIIASLCVAAYMNFKRHKPMDAVFDQFSWIAALLGVVMLALPMAGFPAVNQSLRNASSFSKSLARPNAVHSPLASEYASPAMFSMPSTSCSTTNSVTPDRAMRVSSSSSSSTAPGASPSVGSSIMSSLGRHISERAIASHCCSPPESVPACCLRRDFSRGNSSSISSMRSSDSRRASV